VRTGAEQLKDKTTPDPLVAHPHAERQEVVNVSSSGVSPATRRRDNPMHSI
jgi:hypothetical protein